MSGSVKTKSINCDICTDKFNTSIRTRITCALCYKDACRTCVTTFLLMTPSLLPKCMYCNKEWTLEFVAEFSPKNFHNNKYRNYRANIRLALEKSLLPQAQEYAAKKIKNDVIRQEIQDLMEEQKYLKAMLAENKRMTFLKREIIWNTEHFEEKEIKQTTKFVRSCPGEECNGFLSKSLKCGLCSLWGCKECHAQKQSRDDPDHKCNPDDVATIKLLATDTKPCPKCTSAIYKINGCDQMWCTECHTAFEWSTLRIVDAATETIHNPHFYQHARDNNGGVAPRDVGRPCGGLPYPNRLTKKLRSIGCTNDQIDLVLNAHRMVGHVNALIQDRYPNRMEMNDNMDLRVEFLIGKLTESNWVKELKKREKRREKNRAINLVLTMLTVSVTDLINNIITVERSQRPEILVQMVRLRDYVNIELKKIGDRFNNKVELVREDYTYA